MRARASSGRRFYPFTILWVVLYSLSLWLSGVETADSVIWYFALVIALGVPLTVLLAMELSVHIPGRKDALFIVLASAAWWMATMLLVRSDYDWRYVHALNTVALIACTFTIGNWLAGEIEKAGHLIPVALLGILVDVWSVAQGPSKAVGEQVIEHVEKVAEQTYTGIWHATPVVQFLVLHWPQPGADFMAPLFGFGDLVFIAVFLAGSRRFGIPILKTFWLLLGGLMASIGMVFWLNVPIPALPFICGAFLLGNFKSLKLLKKEWQVTLLICGAVLIIIALNTVGSYLSKG